MPIFRILCLLIALTLTVSSASADEAVRQVQEELRKRNLYFGDVDGRVSQEFTGALKRYQARKGFPASGKIDDTTAASLGVQLAVVSRTEEVWPEEPVLRSHSARQLTAPQRVALEANAQLDLEAKPTPPPPAESPAPSQNIRRERVQQMVQDFLRDAETDDVQAQLRYFTYPVDYFGHGEVDPGFVRRDTERYVKRWPQREYRLTDEIRFAAGSNDTETVVQFPIEFSLSSPNRNAKARGRTMNFWTIRPEGDELKILSISEERLRK